MKQYPRFSRILWDIWLFINVTGKYYLRSFVLNGLQSSSFVTHILFCMIWHFNITGQRSTMRNKALTRSLWEKEKIIYGVCIFKSSELNTNECFINAVFQTFIRMTQNDTNFITCKFSRIFSLSSVLICVSLHRINYYIQVWTVLPTYFVLKPYFNLGKYRTCVTHSVC